MMAERGMLRSCLAVHRGLKCMVEGGRAIELSRGVSEGIGIGVWDRRRMRVLRALLVRKTEQTTLKRTLTARCHTIGAER